MAFELRATDGSSIPLLSTVTTVGRSSDNNVVLSDIAVSRNHMVFKITNNEVTAEDIGSQNGYVLNGLPVRGTTNLRLGDRIMIGSKEFTLTTPGTPLGSSSKNSRRPLRDISFLKMAGAMVIGLAILSVYFRGLERSAERKPASLNSSLPSETLDSDGYRPDAFRQKSLTEIQAESRYRESLRDYYNKNYSRSILGFREALTLNPAHVEAADYLQLAETELKIQLTEILKDGIRSLDNLQYKRAKFQSMRILIILGEQVPSYSRKIAQDILAGKERASTNQEEFLLNLPCDKSKEIELCKKAVDLLKKSRAYLKDEDKLR